MAELGRLLRTKQFSGAPQLSAFLNYIVTEALAGRAQAIKAYSVGVDALGKPDTFDAQNDPSVRVLALRLRKALAAIYSSDQTPHAIVELKVGSYVPEFLRVAADVGEEAVDDHSQRRSLSSGASGMTGNASDAASQTYPATTLRVSPPVDAANDFGPPSGSSASQATMSSSNSITGMVVMFIVTSLVCALLILEKTGVDGVSNLIGSNDESIQVVYAALHNVTPENTALTDTSVAAPSILLTSQSVASRRLGDVSVLLGSALLRDGRLRVSRSQIAPQLPRIIDDSDYTLLLHEYPVDGALHMQIQLLATDTGALLFNSSLIFRQNVSDFSKSELEQIQQLAGNLTSPAGPLLDDYCDTDAHKGTASCDNVAGDTRLANYVSSESDVVMQHR